MSNRVLCDCGAVIVASVYVDSVMHVCSACLDVLSDDARMLTIRTKKIDARTYKVFVGESSAGLVWHDNAYPIHWRHNRQSWSSPGPRLTTRLAAVTDLVSVWKRDSGKH